MSTNIFSNLYKSTTATIMGFILPSQERDEEKLGNIKSSFFYYVTPWMLYLVIILVSVLFLGWDKIYRYFSTNVLLNGLIWTVTAGAMLYATFVNYRLLRTSRFLLFVDYVCGKDVVEEDDMEALRYSLATDGALLNIQNMSKAVDNISEYHHPNFTDKDAMLIKSKFGYRLSNARAGASYFAGILVMLGLLGTFMGLLSTIDAVGRVLGEMGNIGGEDGMSGFITSLAAPLQGMGLAFSSSLFGLSGSLLLGLYTFVCARAHNRFVEDVSRWIDDRIPKINPKVANASKSKHMPPSDDLKTWLTGFAYLATKTHKRMGQLLATLSQSTEKTEDVAKNTALLCQYSSEMQDLMSHMSQSVSTIAQQSDAIEGQIQRAVDPVVNSMQAIDARTAQVATMIERNAALVPQIADRVEQQTAHLARLSDAVDALHDIRQYITGLRNDMSGVAEVGNLIKTEMASSFEMLSKSLADLGQGIDNLDKNTTDVTKTVAPIASVVERVDKTIGLSAQKLDASMQQAEKIIRDGAESGVRFEKSTEALMGDLKALRTAQDRLTDEIKSLLKGLDGADTREKLADLSRLSWQLNAMIEELKSINTDETQS